jgi:hypothetical protein
VVVNTLGAGEGLQEAAVFQFEAETLNAAIVSELSGAERRRTEREKWAFAFNRRNIPLRPFAASAQATLPRGVLSDWQELLP